MAVNSDVPRDARLIKCGKLETQLSGKSFSYHLHGVEKCMYISVLMITFQWFGRETDGLKSLIMQLWLPASAMNIYLHYHYQNLFLLLQFKL